MNIFSIFFQNFIHCCTTFYEMLNSTTFSFVLQIVSLIILSKTLFHLFALLFEQYELHKKRYLFIFFTIPIIAIAFENISEIFKILLPKTPITRTLICFAWVLSCIKFHALFLFLEKLTTKAFKLHLLHKLFFVIELILCSFYITEAITLITYNKHFILSNYAYYATIIFWMVSIIPSVSTILEKLSSPEIPKLLKQQLKVLLGFFIAPHIICNLLEFAPVLSSGQFKSINQIIAFKSLGLIFIISTFHFCFKRIMQLRFLNLSDHVHIPSSFDVTTSFKDTIEQLNLASSTQEVQYIAQNFFHEQFSIAKNDVTLYLRNKTNDQDQAQVTIEQFFNNEKLAFSPLELAQQHKIFSEQEIEFDAFCTNNETVTKLTEFLKSINCNIFIPILNNKQLTGYIVINKTRDSIIYNQSEQNRMTIFAQFLAPALHLQTQKDLYALMQESKETKEALYAKHQEVNQYKESIKKLLKDRIENHIGIIFYKNKHFSFRNKEAQQLIGINPNVLHNHPTTATLINLAQQVEKFKSNQSMTITVSSGEKLVVSAMPYSEPSGGIILTVRRPEPTDIITSQVDAIKDPSKRDYLLYLETTQAGKLINQLIPSNSEPLLQYKIQLLEVALRKNALLLQSHPQDLNDIAVLLHEISLKDSLQIINLDGQQSQECAIKLFGVNPLLQENLDTALLEKLDKGTLFIKNIELLDTTSQQKLAHFIKYGIFTPLKSEQRKFSDVRIICSTEHNINMLLQDKKLTPELHQELKKSSLTLPTLESLSQEDLDSLVNGFIYQTLQNAQTKNNVAALTIKDKNKLLEDTSKSLSDLKSKITTLMKAKVQVVQEETFTSSTPLYNIDTDLELAAQLGKHALKDIKLMTSLWNKFGSQSKIAELLGVNRSSVNRRCKDYNLG